jgi:hypothetical protein
MKSLLDVTCKKIANMIKDKTPEEVRRMFDIKNNHTSAEVCSMQSFFFFL